MLHTLLRDLNQARRAILKTPTVSAIAVLSLALGIAANTTVFSTVHSFLMRPLPYADAGQLVMMWENPVARAENQWPVAPANYFAWREGLGAVEDLMAFELTSVNLTGGERPLRIDSAQTTDNYFQLIQGEDPLVGRTYGVGEAEAGAEPVAVLRESLWRGHFGADPGVVGKTIHVDGVAHSVVGVMPQTFDFMAGNVDIWLTQDLRSRVDDRENRTLMVAARLGPERSVAQAQQEVEALSGRLAEQFPEQQEGWAAHVQPLRDVFPGPIDSRLIKVLQAVALLALLIACVNVAGLLLAKADARQKEMALRTVLGARRGRLLRQLMTESLMMSTLAGLLGLAFSYYGIQLARTGMPDILPAIFWPRMDMAVVIFCLGVSLCSGLAFGFGPATQAVGRQNLRGTLNDGGRGGSVGRSRKRALGYFVMAELALALAILIGASVLTDLFHNRLSSDPGFEADGVLTAQMTLPEFHYPDDAEVARAVGELERRFGDISGVESAALTSFLPRARFMNRLPVVVEGQAQEEDEALRSAVMSVTPNFFETLSMTDVQGRLLTPADREDSLPVVVVNQRFVDAFLPERAENMEAVLGIRVEMDERFWTIVGVIPNYAQERLDGLSPRSSLAILPFAQRPVRDVFPMLKAEGDEYALMPALRQTVAGLRADQPVGEIQSLNKHIEAMVAGPAVISGILFAIGVLALALAAIGIYGVMAFRVSRQTQEIGIRLAVGARPSQIVGRTTWQGLRLALSGLVLGMLPAAVVVGLVRSIFEAGASEGFSLAAGTGPLPLIKVTVLLLVVSGLACLLPSLKVTRVDPQKALRPE